MRMSRSCYGDECHDNAVSRICLSYMWEVMGGGRRWWEVGGGGGRWEEVVGGWGVMVDVMGAASPHLVCSTLTLRPSRVDPSRSCTNIFHGFIYENIPQEIYD